MIRFFYPFVYIRWRIVRFNGSTNVFLTARYRLVSEEIKASFRRFGSLVVDWPHKAESKSYFPPKGYAFLLFQVSEKLSLCYAPSNNKLAVWLLRKMEFDLLVLRTRYYEATK